MEELLRDRKGRDLRPIVAESMAGLFELDEHAHGVLTSLERWTQRTERSRVVVATSLIVFLNLAHDSEKDGSLDAGGWPRILWLLENDDSLSSTILELWRRALATRFARGPAAEVLRHWLAHCEDGDRYLAIERMVMTLTDTPREALRLSFYLRRWSRAEEPVPAARKLLRTLEARHDHIVPQVEQ